MLTLTLPPLGYSPGPYVIRLFDGARGRTRLATYSIVIEEQSR